MKRTFLSGLVGGFNWAPTLAGLAMFIGGLWARNGENRAGAPVLYILGGIIFFLMVFNAWKKSRA